MAAKLLPLWKRFIPRYPIYWKGDPQLRIFLPQFWMKMIKPEIPVPPDWVHFRVHPQMSRLDVKQYLEKIYNVPVLKVNIEIRQDKPVKHPIQGNVVKREEYKIAYVLLGDGVTFEFPDIFGSGTSENQKLLDEVEAHKKSVEMDSKKQWDRISLPPWFR